MRPKMNSASAMMTRMMRIVHNMVGSVRLVMGVGVVPFPGTSKRQAWGASARRGLRQVTIGPAG